MKFKRLAALLTAVFILMTQTAALPVYAESGTTIGSSDSENTGGSADTDDGTDTGDNSGSDNNTGGSGSTDTGTEDTGTSDGSDTDTDDTETPSEEDTFVSRHPLNSFDRLFESESISGFEAYLADYVFRNQITSTISLERNAVYNPEDGSFPVCLSYSNILTLRQYHLQNYSVVVNVYVTDPTSHIRYRVNITSAQAAKLTDAQLEVIRNKADGLNYSLSVALAEGMVIYKGYDTVYSNMGYTFGYSVDYNDHASLLSQAGLLNNFGNPNGTIALYAYGTNQLLKSEVAHTYNLEFNISDENRRGVCLKLLSEDEKTYKKSEAIVVVEELLNKYIGLEEGEIDGVDSDFKYTKEFIANAVDIISEDLNAYCTETELKNIVSDYYLENKPAIIEAMVADIDISQQIRDELDKILGDEVDKDDEEDLEDYVYEQVIAEIIKLLIQYETPIDNDIFKTIHFLLLGRITDYVEDLRDDIITSITNGKSISEFVESLRGKDGADGKDGEDGKDGADGKDGQDGKDGEDGEDFEEWVVRKYGSLDNFLSTISFEGWARRNYGSVDNFVKAMTGSTGLSAYELAVENGYRGTLGMWLESLQGDDGLSAYELAVQNGYTGTVLQWLESLRGEDGKDGKDGRDGVDGTDGRDGQDGQDGKDGQDGQDGADGQVVYVSAGNYASDGDDVVIISPSNTPTAGNVNPSTGIAAGIIIPAAAIGSVLLVKKSKRKRGRKK